MCGIAGILSWERAVDASVLGTMTDRLAHRGPDAGGVWTDGPIGLGHRRLSIIDTSAANNQPLWDAASELVIAFNGEIYNFAELRRELMDLGATFRTHGDTEVILAAYRYWGEGCVERLNGMFAFALWDTRRRQLFLARDRLGEKPLYYVELPGHGIVFASEPRALRAHPAVSRDVDPVALAHYLTHNYALGRGLTRGLTRLAAGHTLLCTEGQALAPKPYWDLAAVYRAKRRFASEQAAAEELLALLDDATRLRLVSDVPLGAFLSGGVDSSAIAAGMARALPAAQVHTFSMGFGVPSFDEVDQARAVARHLGLDHRDRIAEPEAAETLKAMVWAADEPLADTSFIPTYRLAAFAREHVTVALSGDGADECLAGYETYAADRLHRALGWLPGPLARGLWRTADRLLPVSFSKVSLDYKLRHFLAALHLPLPRAHASWRNIVQPEQRVALMQPAWRELLASEAADTFSEVAGHFAAVADCHWIDQANYMDIKTWLADDILVKVDRATMAHGLEARPPFLDHRFVELTAALPPHWKLKGMSKKYLLRQALRGRLPDSVLFGAKRGFNAPVSQWLAGPLRGFARDALTSPRLRDFIRPAAIEQLWREHDAGIKDQGLKLYGLVCLALWLDQL
jgi:asparagine synthase (glutamine-hydrolysing)